MEKGKYLNKSSPITVIFQSNEWVCNLVSLSKPVISEPRRIYESGHKKAAVIEEGEYAFLGIENANLI